MDNILDSVKRLHFVGIGGSGMCPMAELLMNKGYEISGSDMNESDTLDRVKGWGIPVFMGHSAGNIGDAEAVVYTAACRADNPELVAARERGVPTLERSVMLGMLTAKYPRLLAVSGTHGKTTTTSMLTQIFIEAGADPSAIIGGCPLSTATAGWAAAIPSSVRPVNMWTPFCSCTRRCRCC